METSTKPLDQIKKELQSLSHVIRRHAMSNLGWKLYYKFNGSYCSRDSAVAAISTVFPMPKYRILIARTTSRIRFIFSDHDDIGLVGFLPKDAIIIPRSGRVGFVLVSRESSFALKAFKGKNNGVSSEVYAYDIAYQAGLNQFIPRVREYEVSEDSYSFVVTDWSENSSPMKSLKTKIGQKLWLKFLTHDVSPFLFKFYQFAGVDKKCSLELSKKLERRILVHPDKIACLKLLSRVRLYLENSSCKFHLESLTHGDILPSHFHFSDGGWQLIDWGSSRRKIVICDFVVRFIRSEYYYDDETKKFWDFINDKGGAPSGLEESLRPLLSWAQRDHGLIIDDDSVRFSILISLLEDILYRWENAGRDLQDEKFRKRLALLGIT